MKRILVVSVLIMMIIPYNSKGQSTYVDEFNLKISSTDFIRQFTGEIESGDIEINGVEGDFINIVAEVYNAPGNNFTCNPDNNCMLVEQSFLRFKIKPREGEKIKKIAIKVPQKMSISFKIMGNGSVNITNVLGDIQIIANRNGNITLKDVKGPLSLSQTFGDISVDFIKGISKRNMAFSVVKGNININLPKGEAITLASSCFDINSTLKNQAENQSSLFKHINGTVITGNQKLLNENRSLTINASYIEHIESRKFLSKGASNAKMSKDRKVFRTKEDVYVYEINGGGTNFDLNVYQGKIQINEINK